MPKKNATLAAEETVAAPAVAESASCSSGNCRHPGFRIWSAVFVVVLAQVASTAFFSDFTVKQMKDFEYEQRGGKETFELLNKAQTLQIKGQLDQIKSYVEGAEKGAGATAKPADGTSATAPAAEYKTMPKEEVEAIKKTSFFVGKEGARVIAVEYTDPECPFCIRQDKDKILPKLLEKYDGKIQVTHKVFRAVPHEGAEAKSVALLCAAKLGGASAYNAYFDTLMERSTQSKVMPVDEIVPLAKELKLDVKKFSACYDSKETVGQYDANTTEGQKYGVQGTPGTLVIDTETGKYQLIAGAFPFESFSAAVDGLLK